MILTTLTKESLRSSGGQEPAASCSTGVRVRSSFQPNIKDYSGGKMWKIRADTRGKFLFCLHVKVIFIWRWDVGKSLAEERAKMSPASDSISEIVEACGVFCPMKPSSLFLPPSWNTIQLNSSVQLCLRVEFLVPGRDEAFRTSSVIEPGPVEKPVIHYWRK